MVHLLSVYCQMLLPEMYKIKHNLSKSYLKDLFNAVNGNYNHRSQSDFGVPVINTVLSINDME